jgi:PAS domain S-box-containing protein
MELIHPNDRQPLLDAQQRAIETGTFVTVEYRSNPGHKKNKYFKSTLQPVRNAQGQLTHMSGTVLDITELKTTQHELEEMNRDLEKRVAERTAEVHESEATYRALFENANDAIFLIDTNAAILRVNAHCSDLLGYAADELIGRISYDFVVPSEINDTRQRTHQLLAGEHIPMYERRLIRKDGSQIETEINLSLITHENGQPKLIQSVVRDITQRKQTEKMLRNNSELFSEFMHHSPIFTYVKEVTPTESVVLYASENFKEMIGVPGDEMVGKTSVELFPAELAQKINEDDWAVIRNNEMIRLDEELNGRSYTTIKFPIFQADKTLLAGYTIDITESKKYEEALRESRDELSTANAALEKASRLKDEFLASMSHELRTPLTSILGLSEAIQMQTFGALNEKQAKAMKYVETSGRHLLDLINDILDLSKIEAGKLDMQFEACSASDICQASLQLMKGMAHQKKQNISFSIEPVSISVRTDSRRLKQMIVNLLSNAVKFTPEGGQLGLEVQARNDLKAVLFSVWDKGIGIKPEEIGKLFKPFVQLDSSLARQYSGTGLGLSLVQRMAEMHGGSIKVESVPGEGSRFTIILPWSEEVTQPLHNLKERDTGSLKNALVIEDNDLDTEHIIRYLKGLGIAHIIQPVLHGALEKIVQAHPSAILLDLNMPDGSGLDFLARLKADERTCMIPVIITSVEERHTEATKLGAIGYLVKPFTQQELHAELSKAAAFINPTDQVIVIGPNDSAPLVMIADDNEIILELVADFLGAHGCRVIATHSGFELLERAPESQPDIVLVDIQMPGLDGMETMRRLRAHSDPTIASVPIIAITALAMSGDREKCLQAGANEYMSKPIALAQLIEQVKGLLKEKNKNSPVLA